ncbi:MAG: hypothetical protein DMG35_10480 [Acidobacteria bacterium]|nr:MAG: hypothetical protein DMG35_10480 [Acidobacteriota bacterium]
MPRALRFKTEQFPNSKSRFGAAEILGRDAITGHILFGQINAPALVVFMDVTKNVGDLEGEAELFREIQSACAGETEDVGAGQTDRSGDAIAILAQTFEGRVRANRQIHFRATNEIVQITRGDFVALHGIDEAGQDFRSSTQRRGRRGHGGIPVKNLFLTGDGLIESGAPFGESALLGGKVLAFIGDVVDEAHECVEGGESIALRFGKEKKCVVEIAARGARDAMAMVVGINNRGGKLGRSVPRPHHYWSGCHFDRLRV